MLIPTLQDATDVVLALANQPDGTTVDRSKLTKTISALRTIERISPVSLKEDTRLQLVTLEAIDSVFSGAGNRTLIFDDFKTSGIRIAGQCRPYAK